MNQKGSSTLVLAAIVLVALSSPGIAAEGSVWLTTYDEAHTAAIEAKKPLFIAFTASWCGWCRVMEEEVFADATVRKELSPFVCARIDIDKESAAAFAFQVNSVPRSVFINVHGEVIGDQIGYVDVDQFRALLNGVSRDIDRKTGGPIIEVVDPGQQRLEAIQAEQSQLIQAAGTSRLLDLLGDPDPKVRAIALEEIERHVELRLPLLVAGLRDVYLGTRIAAAQQLRTVTELVFDPWAPLTERAESAARWRKWLSEQLSKNLASDEMARGLDQADAAAREGRFVVPTGESSTAGAVESVQVVRIPIRDRLVLIAEYAESATGPERRDYWIEYELEEAPPAPAEVESTTPPIEGGVQPIVEPAVVESTG